MSSRVLRNDDGGVAEGAVGYGHGDAVYYVVDYFMPDEEFQRVGPDVAVEFQDENGIRFLKPSVGFRSGFEIGVVDGWDSVSSRAAGPYFVIRHRVEGEVREPGVEVVVGIYARHAEGPGIGGVSLHGRRMRELVRAAREGGRACSAW